MAVEDTPKVGRRSLLAAATGAIAALVGHAVTSPSRALAADHDPVKIGEANAGTTVTALTTPASHAFEAASGTNDGLRGTSGGNGMSGVYGWITHASGHGVFGRNTANQNWGYVGGPNDAIEGHCTEGGQAGVRGTTGHPSGYGVIAENSVAQTSAALAGPIFGLLTQAMGNNYGLVNVGKTWFSRSGVVTVAAGKRTAKVSSIAITAYSYVFATMQYPRSGVYIQAALPNVDTDSITVYLNKAVTVATKVAWFVIDKDPM